jgi:hypothetical protein
MIPRELPAALVRHALHVSRLTLRPECDASCSELRRVKPIASKTQYGEPDREWRAK